MAYSHQLTEWPAQPGLGLPLSCFFFFVDVLFASLAVSLPRSFLLPLGMRGVPLSSAVASLPFALSKALATFLAAAAVSILDKRITAALFCFQAHST